MTSANAGQHTPSVPDAQTLDDDISAPIQKWIKWWIAASVIFVSIPVAWLISDREPTAKELTLAYRKFVVTAQGDKSPKELAESQQRSQSITLLKRSCKQLSEGRFRCRADIQQNNETISGSDEAADAIYSRDSKGWQFSGVTAELQPAVSKTGSSEPDAESSSGY